MAEELDPELKHSVVNRVRDPGAVRREDRFVVLARHVNACESPAAGLVVGQQEALLAPQPHGATIRRRLGRIYWPSGLLKRTTERRPT